MNLNNDPTTEIPFDEQLRTLGFEPELFSYYQAERLTPEMQEGTFVEYPNFDVIMNLSHSTALLAPQGGGKTAARRRLETALRESQEQAFRHTSLPKGVPFVVAYTNFEMIYDHLPNVTLQEHKSLLLAIIAQEFSHFINRCPEHFMQLPLSMRDWWWAYIFDFIGPSYEYDITSSVLTQDWHRKPQRTEPFSKNFGVAASLDVIQERLSQLGFDRMYILIDGVDGSMKTVHAPNQAALVRPLLDAIDLFSFTRIVWKFFLPDTLTEMVHNSNSFKTRRLDSIPIQWNEEKLEDLLALRLGWDTIKYTGQRLDDLKQDNWVSNTSLERKVAQLAIEHHTFGPPRIFLYLIYRLLKMAFTKGSGTITISSADWNQFESSVRAELASARQISTLTRDEDFASHRTCLTVLLCRIPQYNTLDQLATGEWPVLKLIEYARYDAEAEKFTLEDELQSIKSELVAKVYEESRMTEFIEIQRALVRALERVPITETFEGRSRLLDGLPPVALTRSQTIAQLDLANIINGLHRLGRLSEQGGVRPLIVVIENAQQFVPSSGEVHEELLAVKRALEQYYGGEVQPELLAAAPEVLIFGAQRDTRVTFDFIVGALRIGRSIARLRVPRIFNGMAQPEQGMYGTGWLIAPDLLITNHHVIDARDYSHHETPASPADFQAQAEQAVAWFDYRREGDKEYVECRGAKLMAHSRSLDYALLQLIEAEKIGDRQPLPIVSVQPQLVRGARINIAQHAQGGPLQYAIRNNFYVQSGASDAFIHYQTDTEPGASGSPVCNDHWQVVALHRASVSMKQQQQVPQEVVEGNPVTVKVLNEAVTLHAILNDLPPTLRQLIANT